MKTNLIAHVHAQIVDPSSGTTFHVVGEVACAPRGRAAPVADSVDALIVRAADGDRDAVAAVAVKLTPILLKDAESALGFFEDEAEDVVQDVLLALVEGEIDIGPRPGRARSWLRAAVRAHARRQRDEREEAWARDDDDERGD